MSKGPGRRRRPQRAIACEARGLGDERQRVRACSCALALRNRMPPLPP